jgi:CubicO group peptidase (beta-lactamase class C family)
MIKNYKLVCTIWLSLLAIALWAQPQSNIENKVDQIFSSWSADGPGGAIGIVKDGKLIFSKAYGMASLEYDVPNTLETTFNIASVSKQFTAYALILLEQEGKLSLDDDIRKYLPEVPDFGETITIRHLLTHTSGLRNFQNLLGMAGWREGDAMTNDDLLRYISMQKELNFPVGSEYLYCNTGFVLSTFIVERVTGMDFKEWTRKNIFIPLGMLDSRYREDMTAIHKNSATSYDAQSTGGFVQPLKYWTYMGNGNVYTTIADLARWIDNMENGTLGGKAGIMKLTERGILTNGDTLSYALGIGVGTYKGHRRWSHGGSVGGYRSSLSYFPDEKLGVVVITNFSSANPGGKASQVIDYVLEIEPDASGLSTNGYSQLSIEAPMNDKLFKDYAGSYFVDGVVVDLYQKAGAKFIFAKGQTPELMVKTASDSTFFVEGMGISIFMSRNEMDKLQITILRGSEVLRGIKMEIKPSELSQYAGTYYSEELDTEYTFKVEGDQLMAHHQRHEPFRIFPLDKNDLRGGQFFLSQIDVDRWPNGDVRGIRASNGRVRNLWFSKID